MSPGLYVKLVVLMDVALGLVFGIFVSKGSNAAGMTFISWGCAFAVTSSVIFIDEASRRGVLEGLRWTFIYSVTNAALALGAAIVCMITAFVLRKQRR
jgi:hypothetical protein